MIDSAIADDASCNIPVNRFNPNTSYSYVNSGKTDKISYMDGSLIMGFVSKDTVSFDIDGYYSAENFKFLLAEQ